MIQAHAVWGCLAGDQRHSCAFLCGLHGQRLANGRSRVD
jgi:hypothetical protein